MLITHSSVDIQNHQIFIINNNNNEHDTTLILQLSKISNSDIVPAIKYLGVYFVSQSNFKYHISQISKKCLMHSFLFEGSNIYFL